MIMDYRLNRLTLENMHIYIYIIFSSTSSLLSVFAMKICWTLSNGFSALR